MATREETAYLNDARAGNASAQLILGKYYLFGGAGLKQNLATALYWLHRAAVRNEREAWMLIGTHVPFDIALRTQDPVQLCIWYERAAEAGVIQAGLVWAKLLLTQADSLVEHAGGRRALAALERAASGGIVEAQWLLAQELKKASGSVPAPDPASAASGDAMPAPKTVQKGALEWATCAAANGVLQAQRALADRSWSMQDHPAFLRWAVPVARAIADHASKPGPARQLLEKDAAFLARCVRVLHETEKFDADEAVRFGELAAQAGDKDARFLLGIWYANMDESGDRCVDSRRRSDYRKAIHWLTLAGEQGVAQAWFALFRIHVRPNTGLSQYSVADAQRYLERAAEAGHAAAQLELGARYWRARRSGESNDVRAACWLQRAAAQGNGDALALLRKVAACATPAAWAQEAQRRLTPRQARIHPFLAARIELAALFGLSLREALLLDLNSADQGHCLLIDIRSFDARGKRRLILIRNGEERMALTRVARCFANADCGLDGPEGNYRQRLYRYKKLCAMPDPDRQTAARIA